MLYGLGPEEFVAARDAAAKALRGEGRRAEAAAVEAAKAQRRGLGREPARPGRADLVAALLDAGAKLREVQLAGAAAADLRAAIEAEAKALDALMRAGGADRGAEPDPAARRRSHARATRCMPRRSIPTSPRRCGAASSSASSRRSDSRWGRLCRSAPPGRRRSRSGRRPARAEPEPPPARDEVAAKRLERAAAAAADGRREARPRRGWARAASGELAEAKAELARARRVLKAAETRADGAERAAAAAERARDAARKKADEAEARASRAGRRLMVVHLIDGTYELFRQFYGRRRGHAGATDRRSAPRPACCTRSCRCSRRARRTSASPPTT